MNNYIQLAMRTNSPTVGTYNVPPDILHAALGLADEIQEYSDAPDAVNLIEELSDLCWFTALACNASDTVMDYSCKSPPSLYESVNAYISMIKRWYAYGKVPTHAETANALYHVASAIRLECEGWGYAIDDVMEIGINKLSIRYPDKFTPENAINRDIIAERAELERMTR